MLYNVKILKRNERIQGYIKEILDDSKKHKASEIVEYVDKILRDIWIITRKYNMSRECRALAECSHWIL